MICKVQDTELSPFTQFIKILLNVYKRRFQNENYDLDKLFSPLIQGP